MSTFCGRPYVAVMTEPGLDLLGDDVDRLCRSCWRSVERWLSPPPAAEGEDEVVRWIMSVVLETGEAMVEGVPVPRLESIRRRARSELKAAIGGSVQTRVFGRSALWVHSGLVIDSMTPERWQREMRAAIARGSWRPVGQSTLPDGVAAGTRSPAAGRPPSSIRAWLDAGSPVGLSICQPNPADG